MGMPIKWRGGMSLQHKWTQDADAREIRVSAQDPAIREKQEDLALLQEIMTPAQDPVILEKQEDPVCLQEIMTPAQGLVILEKQ